MSVGLGWPLQQAVYARLAAALATAGPDGSAVPVHDHVRRDLSRLFVRIDDVQIVDASPKNCEHARHILRIHAFSRPEGDAAHGIGKREVRLVQAAIVAALNNWRPLVGRAELRHAESTVAPDEDGLTQHAISKFTITL